MFLLCCIGGGLPHDLDLQDQVPHSYQILLKSKNITEADEQIVHSNPRLFSILFLAVKYLYFI